MTLQQILEMIEQGELLDSQVFAGADLDGILDLRDRPEYEKPWLECSVRINSAWESSSPDKSTVALMDEIRKQSFLTVSRSTSQHEMASYVSDDFELIAKAVALQVEDAYASGLLESYSRGEIPR